MKIKKGDLYYVSVSGKLVLYIILECDPKNDNYKILYLNNTGTFTISKGMIETELKKMVSFNSVDTPEKIC